MAKILTSDNKKLTTYTFLNYEVQPHLRKITQNGKELVLGKKSFDLLLFLLQRQGQVVTKQELMDSVWPGLIITDSTLNKQVARLRSDLASQKANDETVIETVRGVGLHFVPTVQTKQTNVVTKQSNLKLLWWLVPIVLIAMFYFSTNIFKKTPPSLKQESIAKIAKITRLESVNVAIVPSQKNVDWLNVGGLDYLSGQLQKHQEIHIINPRDEWFKKGDSQFVSIELSHKKGIDYVLTVKNLLKDKDYQADLVLRNQAGILAKKMITATNLNLLFDRIDSWLGHQLKISSIINKGEFLGYAPTEFALESFLKGLDIAKHQNYSKAVLLIQAAVNDDLYL